MPAPASSSGATIYRLGSARETSGECNTWNKTWAVQINGTVHQITMKKRLSQKLVVKHDGQRLLDKRYLFAKLSQGSCFVAWSSAGVNFGVHYETRLRCIRTSADHYDLRVDGLKFCDLRDGCALRPTWRRPMVENALKRLSSVPIMSDTSASFFPEDDCKPKAPEKSKRTRLLTASSSNVSLRNVGSVSTPPRGGVSLLKAKSVGNLFLRQ